MTEIVLRVEMPPTLMQMLERIAVALEARPVHAAAAPQIGPAPAHLLSETIRIPEIERPPVAAPVPAAPTPQPAEDLPVWSSERKALVAELYPTGLPVQAIYDRVCALPGPKPRSLGSVQTVAAEMKARRPVKPAPVVPLPPPEPDAPASPPVIAAPEPRPQPIIIWTPARERRLVQGIAAGETEHKLYTALNEMDGPHLRRDLIGIKARALKLPWPPGALKGDAAPIDVTYGTALAWAAERGLAPAREGMDIERVNARRVQLGLAPFRVIRPVVGARA